MRLLPLCFLITGCLFGSSSSSTNDPPLGGARTVTGTVVDFQTSAAVDGAASVSTAGLQPPPRIAVQGSTFTIDDIPDNSAFQILASVTPTHRATYSPALAVGTTDVADVKAYTVSETFLASLATGFGVTPSAAKGVIFIHLVDSAGTAKAGVAGSNLVLSGASGAVGPKFLDATMNPAGAATSTSTSGWAVFFEVPPGAISLAQPANATATISMATSPVAAGTVTIVDATVADGAPPPLPTNVSFSQTVVPIFGRRGCASCHSGNGPGRDLGNLTLDGSTNLIYRELTQETATRVVVAMPEKSLVLTMPSAESPPDAHPNVTFTGPQDPDYLKILVWIREGAKEN